MFLFASINIEVCISEDTISYVSFYIEPSHKWFRVTIATRVG